MMNPGMMDPAVMSFLKQSGEAFKQTMEAEAAGKMDKALAKYCGGQRPLEPSHPNFVERCLLYAAKAYAMAHIDGTVRWGEVKGMLDQSPLWPPGADLKGEAWVYTAFSIGFLHGSELPESKHKAIEGAIPMAAQVAADPAGFMQKMGLDAQKLQEMAKNPKVAEMLKKFGGGGGFGL